MDICREQVIVLRLSPEEARELYDEMGRRDLSLDEKSRTLWLALDAELNA